MSSTAHSVAYAEIPDPGRRIAEAVARAKTEGRRVLVDFGADWCRDCVALSELYAEPAVAALLDARFLVVRVDVGRFDTNTDIVEEYGSPTRSGIPALVVLDAAGGVLTDTGDGSFSNARELAAADLLAFLNRWSGGDTDPSDGGASGPGDSGSADA